MSKYVKLLEKMFHNISDFIVVAEGHVRQKVMVTLALFPLNSSLESATRGEVVSSQ